jgi:hypothetical protein
MGSDYNNSPRKNKTSLEQEKLAQQFCETIEQGVACLNGENIDEALKLFQVCDQLAAK